MGQKLARGGALELVHGIRGAPGEERLFPKEVFLVVVANVGAGEILVLHRGEVAAVRRARIVPDRRSG